jgi:histone deacetylase 1/2
MTHEALLQAGAATMTAELWVAVDEIYSLQTRARAVNTRIALDTTKKGALTASEYTAKMKSLSDEMTVVGKPLGAEKLMSYVGQA